ncbi:MAG: hypothetical protein SGI74_14580 [Oligoflexia bacterium]|nr:hypothetical protein [Oligoflexia bacterium]
MLITIISSLVLFFGFAEAFAQTVQKIEPRPITDFACTKEFSNKLIKDLHEYLVKPNAANTRSMSIRICSASHEGENPCPFNINQDRVAEFETAGNKNPLIVPVLACAVKVADGAIAEELNELQAKLLDKHMHKFFVAWQTIPKEIKSKAQTFDDFALIAPDSLDDYRKKIKIYESRIKLFENVPVKLRPEVANALNEMKEIVANARDELPESPTGEVLFKASKFRAVFTDKIIRLSSGDPKKVAILANQVLQNEGLSYKVYLKGTSNHWSLCSTSSDKNDCHMADVGFKASTDSCGKFTILGALAQLHGLWILSTSSSQFRVNANSYVSPTAVKLQKSENVIRSWNMPELFYPAYITPDLKTMYFKTIIKSDVGGRLAELHLQVRDYAAVQFVDPSESLNSLIPLTVKTVQSIKSPEGVSYNLHLPKSCK